MNRPSTSVANVVDLPEPVMPIIQPVRAVAAIGLVHPHEISCEIAGST